MCARALLFLAVPCLNARDSANSAPMISRQLICPSCQWRTLCGKEDLVARLRLVGVLRREKDPDEELIAHLLPDAASRMTCPLCKEVGLKVVDAESDPDDWQNEDWADDDWQAAVLCEVCREAIDPERLEFLPDTRRCTACQSKSEAGIVEEDEPEFCPRCGSLVELRVSRAGGLTRYKRFCTGSCRSIR